MWLSRSYRPHSAATVRALLGVMGGAATKRQPPTGRGRGAENAATRDRWPKPWPQTPPPPHPSYDPASAPAPSPVVQWSKGEYAGASNTQDDLALISRHLAPRPDDHGDSPAAATLLHPEGPALSVDGGAAAAGGPGARAPGGRAAASATGNIERPGDSDWFAFDAGGPGDCVIALDLVPDAPVTGVPALFMRANPDMRLDVHGPLAPPGGPPPPRLASFDPQGSLLRGAVRAALPAGGRYLVALTGTGDGPDASAGYSNYGSLGEYRLRVEYPAAASDGAAAPPSAPAGPAGAPSGGGGPVPAGSVSNGGKGLNSTGRLRVQVRAFGRGASKRQGAARPARPRGRAPSLRGGAPAPPHRRSAVRNWIRAGRPAFLTLSTHQWSLAARYCAIKEPRPRPNPPAPAAPHPALALAAPSLSTTLLPATRPGACACAARVCS
jgi:hypothetical protein